MDTGQLLEQLTALAKGNGPQGQIMKLKEDIVEKNVGLAVSTAKKFLHSGEPLDDLIQAGYIGLLNAVYNFDLNRGARFSTYGTLLLQGEIRHYIRGRHTTIRIPQWLQKLNGDIQAAQERFYKEYGHAHHRPVVPRR